MHHLRHSASEFIGKKWRHEYNMMTTPKPPLWPLTINSICTPRRKATRQYSHFNDIGLLHVFSPSLFCEQPSGHVFPPLPTKHNLLACWNLVTLLQLITRFIHVYFRCVGLLTTLWGASCWQCGRAAFLRNRCWGFLCFKLLYFSWLRLSVYRSV